MKKCSVIGRIHSIDTYSTLDGYGIRSVVFMQGCHLRCIVCHNPDTWQYADGTDMSSDDLVTKISRYKAYYGAEGGVTFSGGEPLLQSKFILDCVTKLAKLGVKCAIETSGNVDITADISSLLKMLDFVICDIKYATNSEYQDYVGGMLGKTLSFLKVLEDNNIPTWIRTVVVPSINDNDTSMSHISKIINDYSNIFRWELLPFSKLGFHKYDELGIENRCKSLPDLDMTAFNKLKEKYEFEKRKKL
ncbi:MAG: pyruvate formate lyase-activating protein [Clostridiales bacterium]|nr:pyruvate formate lyase-activating protein [Clostridiales bacterium]